MPLTNPRILISALFLVLLIPLSLRAEEINDFRVEIYINSDSSINVEENIEYDFEGELKHGIYRDIPYKYQIGLQKYNLRMNVNKVTDFDNDSVPYKVTHPYGMVKVRIGDPDKEITGVHKYRIEYNVQRAVIFYKDHDELYWNITGNEWTVPIKRASAKISLDRLMPRGVQAKCYTGVMGSTERDCSSNINTDAVRFRVNTIINPGEGLTIVVGLPKGILKEPSPLQKALWFLVDNWLMSFPFITLFAAFYYWYTRGRDPEGKVVIPVKYAPPNNLTPAEAGALMDEKVDTLDITSTVIDLAVRGYIKIHEVPTTKFFFFSDRDYKLEKLKPQDDELKPHEKKVFSGLFGNGHEVMVSDLQRKFYTNLPVIKDSIYASLVQSQFFVTSPQRIRTIFKWIGIGVVVVGFFIIPDFTAKISLVISGAIILIFSRFMPRKTKAGTLAKEELLGFRDFIEHAEKDRIERLAKDDPTLFDRILPFAMVFGLGDKWAEAFHDMYKEPPSWYTSSRYGDSFTPRIFVNDIGRSLSTMNSTFVSTPSRSRSGGSGFSGGSSGGGFGGGGGGSW